MVHLRARRRARVVQSLIFIIFVVVTVFVAPEFEIPFSPNQLTRHLSKAPHTRARAHGARGERESTMLARVASSMRASSSRADRATTTNKSLSFDDGADDDGADDDASVSLSDADALMVTSSAPTRAVHGAALIAASTARCDLV